MIGLDTNVVLRLLTGDDPRQQRRAKAFIARNCSAESPAFINRIVLVETVWVLESFYKYSLAQVATAIDALLRTSEFSIEDTSAVWKALKAYQTEAADFAEALIARTNDEYGCEATITFDARSVKRIEGMRLPE